LFDFSLDFTEQVLSIFLEQRVTEDTFGVFLSGLVETIHIQLSDEAVDFVVSKEFGEHNLLKLVDVLDDELCSCGGPIDDS
jgi:hypothetical protein